MLRHLEIALLFAALVSCGVGRQGSVEEATPVGTTGRLPLAQPCSISSGVVSVVLTANETATLCPSQYTQLTVSEYLATQPWFDQVKVFRELYRERRDALLESLDGDDELEHPVAARATPVILTAISALRLVMINSVCPCQALPRR